MGFYNKYLHFYLLEFGPLVTTVLSLWIKQIYFARTVQDPWWERPESNFAVSAGMATLLILFSPVAFLPRIRRFVVMIVVNLSLTLIILSDTIFFRFYRDIISLPDLSTGQQLGSVIWSVYDLLKLSDALYFLDIVLGCVFLPLYVRLCAQIPANERQFVARLSAGLLVSGFLVVSPTLLFVWKTLDKAT